MILNITDLSRILKDSSDCMYIVDTDRYTISAIGKYYFETEDGSESGFEDGRYYLTYDKEYGYRWSDDKTRAIGFKHLLDAKHIVKKMKTRFLDSVYGIDRCQIKHKTIRIEKIVYVAIDVGVLGDEND